MTKAEMQQLTIAGLREGLEIAHEENERLRACKHFQTVGPGTHLATTPAHTLHLNCPWCEVEQLRGTLSLAEEGLANYAQEVKQLRQEIEVLRLYGNKDCTGMADAELERRRAEPQPAEHK